MQLKVCLEPNEAVVPEGILSSNRSPLYLTRSFYSVDFKLLPPQRPRYVKARLRFVSNSYTSNTLAGVWPNSKVVESHGD